MEARTTGELVRMSMGLGILGRSAEAQRFPEFGCAYRIGTFERGRGDSMDGGRGGLCFSRGLGSLDRIESGDPSGASDPP
ncbi:hypothetical protein Tco_1475747 [Tanacetum coccineum]